MWVIVGWDAPLTPEVLALPAWQSKLRALRKNIGWERRNAALDHNPSRYKQAGEDYAFVAGLVKDRRRSSVKSSAKASGFAGSMARQVVLDAV